MKHPAVYLTIASQLRSELRWLHEWSEKYRTCKRKAVGVSILALDPDNGDLERIAIAHNGPSGVGAVCNGIKGACGCSHAEPRAILHAVRYGWTAQTSRRLVLVSCYSPCTNCANVVIDSGIIFATVYDVFTDHDPRGVALLVANMKGGILSSGDLEGPNHDKIAEWC